MINKNTTVTATYIRWIHASSIKALDSRDEQTQSVHGAKKLAFQHMPCPLQRSITVCLADSGVCDTLVKCDPDTVSDDVTEQGSELLQSRAEHQQGGVPAAVVVNSCVGAMNSCQSWLANIWAPLPRLPPPVRDSSHLLLT